MKKLILLTLLSLAVVASGCTKKVDPITGVRETGRVIEAVNGQSYTAEPGDVVHVRLTGQAKAGKQWSVAPETSINLLLLKNHQITGLEETASPQDELVDEWWLKIEQTGQIDLSFNYGAPGSEVEKNFTITIISQ